MAKYLDYDGLSKLWSKIGDHFVKKTGNKSESITGDKKFTGTTTIGGTNIYSATAQVLGTNQNVTSFSGNKILFKNGATFEGTALDAGLCTRGICGTDTGGTSKSELYLNYDGNNNYSRKVVLGAGSTGESLGANCGFTFCAVRGDEMKNYVKAAIESYPGVNKKGTVTSIKLNTTYTSALSASSAEEISTSGTFNLHKVSKTGSYNDLNNKPTIPTVHNGKLTIQRNGVQVGTFTADQSNDTTANITVPTKLTDLTDRTFSNIASRGESFLSWGGQNFSGSYGPIDACMVPDLGANRFAFIPASAWKVEYSRDSGATWTDYGASDGQKLALTTEGTALSIGKADSSHKATAAYMLRITLTTTNVVYTVLNKFLLYVSTNGSGGSYVTIQGRTKANLDASKDTWTGFVSKVPIAGWSGWNVINTSGITTHGNQAGHYAQLRFIFGCTSGSTTYSGLQIQKLFAYGGVGWTTPSNMAKNGHMYKYDYNQNVKFPKKLYVNETKEVLATGQTNTFTGTSAFNSGKIYLGQGDNNALDLGTDGRINSGNSTLVGFVGGTFTLGHSTYNTNIRGKAARPTYNGSSLALQSDLSGKADKSSLAAVATSGSYNDLSNKPAIPDISGKADKSSLAKVATSGLYNDLSGVPTLSTVARTGSYNDLSNKPNAVTYSTSGSNYYLWAFGGRYKISAPGTLNSDGTYKDVTIITSENLSSQGLFVPMVGTGSTPMSGDIQIKGEYEGTNASSGPISGGSGQTHTSPRNADLSLGLKGISYHYYGNDNTYGGSSGLYTDGVCYKAKETSGGSYSKLDYLLDAGLTVFQYSGQSSANPVLSNVKSTTMTYDGKLIQREGTTTTIKSIKNLMEKLVISRIDGTGYATYGYVKDEMTGLMICYGTTGQISGAGCQVTFSTTFKGAPTVIVSPFFKSLSETSIVAQYRNSATIRCYIDSAGSNVNSTGSGSAIKGFILDTGNGEKQYFNYIAIGQYK